MQGEANSEAPHPHDATSADWRWLLTLLLVLGVFLWCVQLRSFGHTVDSTVYLAGAKSLAEGVGYRHIAHFGAPRIGLYPPAQSAWLALWWHVGPEFPGNVPWLNLGMIVLALAQAATGFLLLRELGTGRAVSFLSVLCWSISSNWCRWLFWMFSDFAFCALCWGAAWWWLRRQRQGEPTPWLRLGLLMALACLFRTAALGIIVPLALLAARRGLRGSIGPVLRFCAPVAVAMGFWRWLSTGTDGYAFFWRHRLDDWGSWPGYVDQLLDNAAYVLGGRTFWETFCDVVLQVPESASRRGWRSLALGAQLATAIGAWLLVLLAVFGGWRERVPVRWFLALIGGVYGAQVVLFPDSAFQFHRYLYVALPVVVAWATRGGTELWRHWPAWRRVGQAGTMLLALLTAANAFNAARYLRGMDRGFSLPELEEVAKWTRTHTPTNTIVAVSHYLPTIHFHTWSGRPVVMDYLSSERVADNPVTWQAQGFQRADYRLRRLDQIEAEWARRFTPVFASSNRFYQLFAVTPEMERFCQDHIRRFTEAGRRPR